MENSKTETPQHACLVCGIDEAGRGPLAGPVSAAAVILGPNISDNRITDSKKLKEKTREELFDIICNNALSYSIVMISPEEIDRINILQATLLAMKTAASQVMAKVNPALPYFLVDGNRPFETKAPIETIIKGDSKLRCIGAASILAKVSRDRLMLESAKTYPEYGFEIHKGYPTAQHREAVAKYGPCPIHRTSFKGVKEFCGTSRSHATWNIRGETSPSDSLIGTRFS